MATVKMLVAKIATANAARNLTFTLAFLAVAIGCWLERPSAGLIVPGAFVCCALAWSHLTGGKADGD